MNPLLRLWRSSLGKKYVMALTGAGLFAFTLAHMLGNLQFFLGPEPLNRYGQFLKSTGELLWVARLGLLGMVLLHIVAAVQLVALNRAARPVPYAGVKKPFGASTASQTMIWSGLIILSFVIYHLLHYTAMKPGINGLSSLGTDGKPFDFSVLRDSSGRHDIFAMMVFGFKQPIVAIFYMISVGLLCYHLSHGVAAMFNSLGLRDHNWAPRLARFSRIAAIVLFLGYAAIPAAVLAGYGSRYVDEVVSTNAKPMGSPRSGGK